MWHICELLTPTVLPHSSHPMGDLWNNNIAPEQFNIFYVYPCYVNCTSGNSIQNCSFLCEILLQILITMSLWIAMRYCSTVGSLEPGCVIQQRFTFFDLIIEDHIDFVLHHRNPSYAVHFLIKCWRVIFPLMCFCRESGNDRCWPCRAGSHCRW